MLIEVGCQAREKATVVNRYLSTPEIAALLKGIGRPGMGREFANRAGDELGQQLGGAEGSTIRAARFVIEELAANVAQHSESPETSCAAVRAYPGPRRFQIAFADAGIGLKASLEKNPEFQGRVADETEAIKLAMTKGVTRNGKGNLGIGLSFLTDLSDRLGGDLWIASGTAQMHRHGPHEARRSEFRAIASWQGVWICLDAPAQP